MEFTPVCPQSFRTSVPSRCDERDGGSETAPLLGTLVCVVPEFVSSYSIAFVSLVLLRCQRGKKDVEGNRGTMVDG